MAANEESGRDKIERTDVRDLERKGRAAGASGSSRLPMIGGLGLVGLVLVGLLVWWFLFRDTSASSVADEAAAQARQEAIAAAATETDSPASADIVEGDGGGASYDDQADVPAGAGGSLEGLWTVDTTIGTFNDACLESVCDSTFVGFRINEELSGIGAKTVVGRTPGVNGSIEIAGTQIVAVDMIADMRQLITDSGPRTDALKTAAGGLETETFPQASFTLTEPIEMGSLPAEGTAITVQATGDLTVHGVSRIVTIPLTAELQAGVISVFGSLEGMLLSDYDIPTPSAIVVLSVEDNATMELQLWLSR